MEYKTNKKSNRNRLILGIVVIGVILLTVPFIFEKNKVEELTQEVPEIRDIKTYYSFSGVVESKNRQQVLAPSNTQVDKIYVQEGEQVEKGQVVLELIGGNEIEAQINGKVSVVNIKEDEMVMSGTKIMDIVDYDDLQVAVKVDEYEYPHLELGQEVEVSIGAVDKEMEGKISRLSDEAINQNGISYFTGIIDLAEDEVIKVGMNAEAKVIHEDKKGILTLSMEAIQFDEDNQAYVLVKTNKKNPIKNTVKTGVNDGMYVEIVEGINKEDIIIIPKSISEYPEEFMPPFARK